MWLLTDCESQLFSKVPADHNEVPDEQGDIDENCRIEDDRIRCRVENDCQREIED